MRAPFEIIESLAAVSSRLAKEQIIKDEMYDNNHEFFSGVKYSLDPMITFGVRQVPEKTGADGPGLSWDTFETVLQQLATRQLTGNAAKDVIDKLVSLATLKQWNKWYRPILLKDLRAGVGAKTFNKVTKHRQDYYIPIFSCQLAHEVSAHQQHLVGKKQLEYKLDGVRMLSFVYPNGLVVHFSRTGKEFYNFTKIKEQLCNVSRFLSEPMVFDGEVVSTEFRHLMTQVRRKTDVDIDNATYCMFDMIPMAHFYSGVYNESQLVRSERLNNWYAQQKHHLHNILVAERLIVDLDDQVGHQQLHDFEKQALLQGYEGIMIKDTSAAYETVRSVAWLKKKPVVTLTMQVVKVVEGTKKNKGKMGALLCHTVEDGIDITASVGTGFTDKQRVEIMENADLVVGQLVEVHAGTFSKNKKGEHSLLFTRFSHFRSNIPGEKI